MSSKNVIIIILEDMYVEITSRWYIDSVIKKKKCYKLKFLKLNKRKNLVLGLTQENLIENSI